MLNNAALAQLIAVAYVGASAVYPTRGLNGLNAPREAAYDDPQASAADEKALASAEAKRQRRNAKRAAAVARTTVEL